ncbi:hypothetical protein FN846DRAFT_886579 [Sphaerosporella brunnea]|uniref:Uncharacterized protein n=1 Tax=Sphaerosporella brunnea TaxID=1250544 RepID=A0A5J5F8Z3_9PEZI|nr:hypothetical protein FN846DRAFT_886579 [Sphaerosporella brunnea]
MDLSKLPNVPSRWADLTPSPIEDQAAGEFKMDVPFPPEETTNKAVPNGDASGTVANCLLSAPKSMPPTRTSTPGSRKSIKYRGRNVFIQIPFDTQYGLPDGPPIPLTKEEVEKRMNEWIEQGFVIELGGQGACKEIYPEEQKGKVDGSDIFVSIPDPREWETYVNALREDKLRALGVILDEGPPTQPGSLGGGSTPLSNLHSPAQLALNPFSPPIPTGSAMSNPHVNGPFNPFSPISIPANVTPVPPMMSPAGANHHLVFHLPRQSVSISGTSANPNEWDPYGGLYTPPIPQPTPPSLAGSGVWSPPFAMRNGSPGMLGISMHGHSQSQSPGMIGMPMHSMHVHSASQFNLGGYPMENPMDAFAAHHGLVGQERFHQQQVRRGSPLAQVRHSMEQEHEEMPVPIPYPGPAIDAPVPKHRHQLSVTLQKEFEDSEAAYQQDESGTAEQTMNVNGEGFATNPVSPAPASFPEQPEMPSVENDVHNGPELASNPDDDVSDIEMEKQKNMQEAKVRDDDADYPPNHYATEVQPLPQKFMPQSQYVHPHSREQSLSQLQHEYDTMDPVQNSAMSMLMAGEGLGGGADELLSEDGRTNISDIVTNPSEPPSPRRKFSTTTNHTHHMSNTSNAWISEAPHAVSTTSSASKPKFNVNAAEFKFDPSASFTFVPKNTFSPPTAMAPMTSPEGHSRDHSSGSAGGFTGFGSAFNGGSTFRPNLANTTAFASIFEKGAAAFSPNAPVFTPAFAKNAPPPPAANSIFGDIVKPPPVKKVIPIVRPPSRIEKPEVSTAAQQADEQRDPREESVAEESRKRAKHAPATDAEKDVEVPALETMAPPAKDAQKLEEVDDEAGEDSDDEGEKLMETPLEDVFAPFEFQNKSDAEAFANATPRDDMLVSNASKKEYLMQDNVLSPDEALIAATLEASHETSSSSTPEPVEKSSFSIKPATQGFNFEFPTPSKKIGGMSESRYAHSPSPPPSEPAPPPPVLPDSAVFLPPRQATPYEAEDDVPEKTDKRAMPTDAELDEVIKYMDQTDTVYLEQPSEETITDEDAQGEESSDEEPSALQDISTWKHDSLFDNQTPHKQLQHLRSAGPSPSPRRAETPFHLRHSSFSPEEAEIPHAISDRYDQIGIAKDVDSDWDDMLSEDAGGKLRPQSRLFFDAHVEELVGGLFQRRLEPVLDALAAINDTLNSSTAFSSTRGFGEYALSDADDEETLELMPPRPSKDRKLDKIKAALSEVLSSQQNGTTLSEYSLQNIKDAVAATSRGQEFAEVKSLIADILANAAHNEDLIAVKEALEDVSSRIVQSVELVDLKATIVDAIQKTSQVQEEAIRAQSGALQNIAKTRDVAAVRDAVRGDVLTLRDSVRDAIEEIVTTLGDRVDDTKFVLQDVSMRVVQRSDISEIKAAINNTINTTARKEDLVPLHNVLAEVFAKSAKTDELTDINNVLIQILNNVHGIDTRSTHQEVRIKQDNDRLGAMLQEVLRLAQDNTANMDFHQEAQRETVKEGQAALTSRVGEVYAAVREMTKFVQSRASKSDMRRNLSEQEQKQDTLFIKNSVVETHRLVQEGLKGLGKTQSTLDDFRSVVESLAGELPKVDEFKSAIVEVTSTLPGLDDIKRGLQDIIKTESGIEEFKKVVLDDRHHTTTELQAIVERVAENLNQQQFQGPQPSLQDFRALMEDVISKQQLFVPLNFNSEEDGDSKEQLKKKIEYLEKDVVHFQRRAEDEVERKRQWQEKTIELETRLKLAEEEAARQREEAEEKDHRLKAVDEKRHQTLTSAQMRSALLEGAHSSLQKANGELSAKNAELEGAAREALASEEKHRAWNLQLENENKELRRAIETLKSEMEESIKVRESFRTKFDRVQEDMRRVSSEIGQEQSKWRKSQEEQKARIEVLEAKLAAEVTKSQGLEGEVRRLEVEEKESIRLRIENDQLKRANGRADELINQLRHESIENQSRIAQLTHAVDQARDAAETEIKSIREALGKQIEEAAAEKVQLERVLEEEHKSKISTLQEAEQSKSIALQEQQHKFEREIEEARHQHERAYRMVTEDAERDQYFLQEKLNIAQSDSKNLRDHISSLQMQVKTLNENFKIANVAAQAAAQAATTVREMTAPQVSDERALRESVHVLQNQLQAREARIDELEGELSDVNINKSKVREIEGQLNMYRELLDLRIDDLEEIIHTCNLPHLDRGSLRDAATRLKASLEMQLHEKERAMGITKPEDKIAAVSLAAASVASAAWNSWKNRGKNPNEPTPKDTPPSSTPSRPASAASGFLNGILTPPSTTLAGARKFGAGFGRSNVSGDTTPKAVAPVSAKQMDKRPAPMVGRRDAPSGPSAHLFRKDNYDADADSSVLSGEFCDDEDDATETGGDHGDMEPFGQSPYSRFH